MHNDNDDTVFVLNGGAGAARFVFTTIATLKSSGPDRRPLWWYEPRSEVEMTSIAVWLSEHRNLWFAWREIAENEGPEAVGREIARLWSLGPIESCASVMFTPGDDPRDLSILAMLVTRNSEVVRHRFKSAAHRRAFTEWYLADLSATSTFLLFEGCLIGPSHLRRLMDQIAASEISERKRGCLTGRRSGGMRKAG